MYSCQVINENPPSEEPDAERTRLSKRAVVDRALKLADADGLDTLTIRKLAQDLGVTPMALYWHFRSKDDLLEGMAEQVWSEIDVHVDPSVPWWAQLQAGLESLLGCSAPTRPRPSWCSSTRSRTRRRCAPPRPPSRSCAAPGSIRSTPARSPGARCGPGSCWS